MSQTFTFPVQFQAPVTVTQGLTGTFFGDGSNLTGASLPGQSVVNTTVQSNSANWNTAYNVATAYQSVSGSFATDGLQTTLNYLSTNNITISSAEILESLIVYGTLSALSAEFVNITNTFVSNITSLSTLEISCTLITYGDILSGNQNLTDIFVLNNSLNSLSGNWQTAYQQTSANDLVRSNSTFETPTTGISAVQNIVSLSQVTYDALTVKLPTTLYVIV